MVYIFINEVECLRTVYVKRIHGISLKQELEMSSQELNPSIKEESPRKWRFKRDFHLQQLGKLQQSLSNRISVKKNLSRSPLITL